MIDRDRGAKALLRRIRSRYTVQVGIVEPMSRKRHSSGLTYARLGAIHEFGTDTIPRRSFVRDTIDQGNFDVELRRLGAAIWKGDAAKRSQERLAKQVVKAIVARINSNIPPPLAPSTVKRKGHNLALVDTGELRAAISYKIKVNPNG